MLPDNPDDQARFFYLALLGMAVAGGLFHQYRGRMGPALQHAAIWVLIFLGAVLAVGFWEPLMRQLNPDQAAVASDGTVALRRAADGHFYANAEVNGTPVRFMVDTGASNLVLSRRDAGKAGIDLDRLSFIVPVYTANGRADAAQVRLRSLSFGGGTDTGVPAMVNGGATSVSLMGMDYLERFRSVRIEGDTLLLER